MRVEVPVRLEEIGAQIKERGARAGSVIAEKLPNTAEIKAKARTVVEATAPVWGVVAFLALQKAGVSTGVRDFASTVVAAISVAPTIDWTVSHMKRSGLLSSGLPTYLQGYSFDELARGLHQELADLHRDFP